MLVEGQRVAVRGTTTEARFVALEADEASSGEPDAVIVYDDGTVETLPVSGLEAL
jgi:hypothetical protein